MSSYRNDFSEIQKEAYWSLPKIIIGGMVLLAAFYAFGFIATGGDLAIYRFWAPKRADAEREVFQNTQSYVQGKIQNLSQLCYQESRAEGNLKAAIAGVIRNEAATIDLAKLPRDERSCVIDAREN